MRDSGPGLDVKSLDRLFDAFYTTKPHGLGMGLASAVRLSKRTVETSGQRPVTPEAPSFSSGHRFATRKCHESSAALVLTLQHAIDLTHLFGGQRPMVQGPAVIFDLRDGSETWDR